MQIYRVIAYRFVQYLAPSLDGPALPRPRSYTALHVARCRPTHHMGHPSHCDSVTLPQASAAPPPAKVRSPTWFLPVLHS